MALSEAQAQGLIEDIITLLDEYENYITTNAQQYENHEALLLDNVANPLVYPNELLTNTSALRAQLNGAMLAGRSLLSTGLREYAQALGFPETRAEEILARLYTYFHDNSKSVTRRNITHSTPAMDGGNTGTGTIHRLELDENGYELENVTLESVEAKCVRDEHSGAAEHEEVFEVRGASALPDALILNGSGLIGELRSKSARDSAQYIRNPSFANYSGTLAVPTEIEGWTVGNDIANLSISEVEYYRDNANESTPRSLAFDGTAEYVEQNLNLVGQAFNPAVPYYVQIAWKRGTATAGTLTLTFGNVTANVAIAAQSGWQILKIAIGANNWFRTWNKEDPTVKIDLSGANGTIWVDDVIVTPYTEFDGYWLVSIGGATPYLLDDKATWNQALAATEAKIQYWLWRLFGMMLPPSATPTWGDP